MDDFFYPFLLQLRKLNEDDSMNKIIEIKNLTFSYLNTSNPILNNLSFSVKENSWTTLIGHNGSGKSTIARLLIGLLVAEKDKKDPYA
ncbi:ATP-binding cassette domain-containing protein, partial [Micrococcus luteus]|nr:ATP-binding cassette domain-containing protein [Micrococcus luteus]